MIHSKSLEILAIEDNTGDYIILEEYLKEVLPRSGVTRKAYLAEAKAELHLKKYDVVLLDITLPDSNGQESIIEIMELTGTTPVIVFTGYADRQFGIDSLKLGVQDYLVKDEVTPGILFKSIGYALERKSIINEIKASEENYRFLFDKNPVPLFIIDPHTYEIVMINDASMNLYLYGKDEFLSMSVLDLHQIEARTKVIHLIDEIGLKLGAVYCGEWKHLKSDGTIIEVEITTHYIKLEERECRLVAITDVTERNNAKRSLQDNEKRFRSMVQSGSDIIGILDKNGNYTYKSPSVENILGYTPDFLKGKNAFDLIHPDDIPSADADFRKVFYEHIVDFKPFRVMNNEGKWRWIETNANNLLDDPAVNGIVTNSRDITDKKVREDEKNQLIHELIQNNKDLKQFSYITSHNLRAPLTNLLGVLDLIDESQIKDETTLFFLEVFKKSTVQLDDTINDLIKILVVKDNASLPLEKVNLTDVFVKTTELLSTTISNINAEINFDFNDAPAISYNNSYLESIFINLLTNSLKFHHPGRRAVINVYSKSNAENGTVTLYFNDNGLGIDLARNGHKIFGMHQRFHENSEGKGIGLYLIQSQIKTLGGDINVESNVNEGTSFIVTFKKIINIL